MKNIILDEQFKYLLPSLDEETYKGLEESILEHGCIFPLVLWNDILIDGYNRYKICIEHDVPFETIDMEFSGREDATIWIIENQILRRNLTPMQLSYFRGLHYNADKDLHGDIKRVSESASNALNNAKVQNEPLGERSTATRLADHYNVDRSTIKRNAKLATGLTSIGEISPEIKKKILSGEIRISKNRLESLSSAPRGEIEDIIEEIESGEFVSRVPRNKSNVKLDINTDSIIPELKQLNTIISSFASNFNSMFQKLNSGDSAELKPVIRTLITELEDLYGSL